MSPTTSTILLAEEHDVTRAFLAENLIADGYRVLIAPDRAKAIALLTTSHPELRARIAAVLRRSELRQNARILRAGPIVIDVRSREVRVFDRPVELSAKEYDLLVTLAGEPTRVFTRAELMRAIWGRQTFGHTRTLDSHASRLRRKLCGDGAEKLVINVWGVGWRLIDGEWHRTQSRSAVR